MLTITIQHVRANTTPERMTLNLLMTQSAQDPSTFQSILFFELGSQSVNLWRKSSTIACIAWYSKMHKDLQQIKSYSLEQLIIVAKNPKTGRWLGQWWFESLSAQLCVVCEIQQRNLSWQCGPQSHHCKRTYSYMFSTILSCF